MIIAWFSCGATSAVACKLALNMYQDVRIVYIETGSAHPDNQRFIADCKKWYGQNIETISSPEYKNVEEVLLRRRYINGPFGAPCTYLLKKQVRISFEENVKNWDGQVFGFDFCEKEINRAIRFKQQNPKTKPLFPLIDKMITKQDALAMLQLAGIDIPVMYRIGYNNNNCIGCVKGGIGYWNKIRKDFPQTFSRMAQIERIIHAACLKDNNGPMYLDELEPNRGNLNPIIPDCSLFCSIEFQNLIDPQTKRVLSKTLSINDCK